MKNNMLRKLFLYSCLLFSTAGFAENRQQYRNPTGKEFPILAWYSVLKEHDLTPERYMELREAGFNLSFSFFTSADHVAKALKACKGAGVKLILTCPELEEKTAEIVTRFQHDDGVAGWFLRDEPAATTFGELRKFRDRVYDVDKKHLIYLNLFPNLVMPAFLGAQSYRDYMQRSVDELGLTQISYDYYPIVVEQQKTVVRPTFYANLEDARQVSLQSGQPFWSFVLSTAHATYPVPTPAHLRFQAFNALAYGAQCIQYFTYCTPRSATWDFHDAPIDSAGKRMPVYNLVKDLNHEIQRLSWVFLGSKALMVAHTGAVLPGSTQLLEHLPAGVEIKGSDGEGILVSHLVNGKHHFIMLVNRDIERQQTVELNLSTKLKRVSAVGKLQRLTANERTSVTLAPGDYALYHWR